MPPQALTHPSGRSDSANTTPKIPWKDPARARNTAFSAYKPPCSDAACVPAKHGKQVRTTKSAQQGKLAKARPVLRFVFCTAVSARTLMHMRKCGRSTTLIAQPPTVPTEDPHLAQEPLEDEIKGELANWSVTVKHILHNGNGNCLGLAPKYHPGL